MNSNTILHNYLSKQNTLVDKEVFPLSAPDIIVVIPCHNEPDIIPSLNSLFNNDREGIVVEVIIVVNHGENTNDSIFQQNNNTVQSIMEWVSDIGNPNDFIVRIIKAFDLPSKKAGVGLARKIGMDEACQIFAHFEKDGIIACYDADSLCLNNYCKAVLAAFDSNARLDALSIHYEHPVSGNDFDRTIYEAIIQYELHLRYFIQKQRDLQLPFAYHTVGSSMAVKASSYARFGGMNQRKAGEDFYFLQKIIENGKVKNLGTTMVIPSPRTSDRVPFGTGKAINEMIIANQHPIYYTYHPNSFKALKPFVDSIPDLYENEIADIIKTYPLELKEYFEAISFVEKIEESKKNTATFSNFKKRIFKHFNAFQLMKYLHFARDHYYPNIPVEEALQIETGQAEVSLIDQLMKLRQLQKD